VIWNIFWSGTMPNNHSVTYGKRLQYVASKLRNHLTSPLNTWYTIFEIFHVLRCLYRCLYKSFSLYERTRTRQCNCILWLGLVLSWCGDSEAIRGYWNPWGISRPPRATSPHDTPARFKLRSFVKIWKEVVKWGNEWMKCRTLSVMPFDAGNKYFPQFYTKCSS